MTVAPVLRATHVRRPAEDAFALFTDHIGAWWPLPTHGLFAERSATVGFEGGALVEHSVEGERTVWGEVLVWQPPERLVISWHPGRPGVDGEGPVPTVEVTFTPDPHGTRIELVHSGWESFGSEALQRRSGYVGPAAWGFVLDHLADLGDRIEPGPAVEELAAVRARYAEFFEVAGAGPFDPPPPGEWSAAQVVAHLAVNDGAMAAICRGLIEQRADLVFDNTVSNDAEVLDRWIAGHAAADQLPGLIEAARRRSADLVLLFSRLDDEQRKTAVHARLFDAGAVVLDEPRPWWELAVGVQAGFHLPLHTEQVRALRRKG